MVALYMSYFSKKSLFFHCESWNAGVNLVTGK